MSKAPSLAESRAPVFDLTRQGNKISFNGRFDITQFRRALTALHDLITVRGYKDICLDFSNCEFTHAPPMLALAAAVETYQGAGIDFDLLLPLDGQLNRLFYNCNWAHIIQPSAYPLSQYQSRVHMAALRFRTSEEQHELIEDLLNELLASITDFERSHFKAIEWSISEITDNVLVHSGAPRGGLIQLTAKRNVKQVEFVVCDSGIGIPQSLGSSGLKISSDVDALAKAVEQGITRDKSLGQGNGLFGSYQIAVKSGGQFSVHSGNATLYYTAKTGMHTRGEAIPMIGTMVVCGIDYTLPLLLEDALKFKAGSGYTPVDLIELKYENSNRGRVAFTLKNESESLRARLAGTEVRNKLRNLMAFSPDSKIEVNFEGIHLISSSFADEVFGKLFLELGPVEFSARIEFRNIDTTVKQLIDKAIVQRMATH